MPRITDIMLHEQKEMNTLVVRTRTTVQNLPKLIGGSYGKIAAYLGELQEVMADIPFVAYQNMDMQDLDVEIGFPVAKKLLAKGDIKAGIIPAGLMVSCMYQGAYGKMQSVYEEMTKWMQENGYAPSGAAYECYYNGPDYPENLLLTRIMMQVKRV